MGWNALRDQIFANQKRPGVVPANAELTPWPADILKNWDTLSADEKKLFARQAEVFAGYAAYTDNEIGRVLQEIQDEGKLDNTLIIYIVGDNGTSPEGTTVGTPSDWTAYNGILDVPIADQLKYYDAWGGPRPTHTWRWDGRGRLTRRSSGPSRWRRISAAHGRVSWNSDLEVLIAALRPHLADVVQLPDFIFDGKSSLPDLAEGADPFNVTGVWECNDSGIYYVRNLGREVWWFGRGVHPHQSFANVAYGQVEGVGAETRILKLRWADVPAGTTNIYGRLVLQLNFSIQRNRVTHMTATESSGLFGGSHWTWSAIWSDHLWST